MTPRLYALAAALLLALALAQTGSLAGVATVITTAVLVSVIAAALVVRLSEAVTGGARASVRRQALYVTPEPSHPDTAGRPRTRAPSQVVPAA